MTKQAGILFIGAEDEENLAIRSLAAFCRREGIASQVTGFSHPADTETVLRGVTRQKPAMLAVSIAFQCKAEDSFTLLSKVRESGFRGHIVAGGHFPTFEYRQILQTQPAIDSVLRFEGEHGIVPLVRALSSDGDLVRVPNLVYRDGGTIRENPCMRGFMELDSLPFPMRSRKAQRRLGETFASLISSRGCWHSSCVYCCIGAFHRAKGAKFALRSADNVAEEIAGLHRVQGATLVQFHDDNFVLGTPAQTCGRLRDITRELVRRGIRPGKLAFLIKARPDVVDESVAEALQELGCIGVFLGVENVTESGLKALARGMDLDAVNRALEALLRRGLAVTYNLLVFHPHATVEEVRANVDFVRAHLGVPFDFGRAEIVAGSQLERLTIHENLRCGRWPMWDYVLRDAAAQRAFEIYRATFRMPGSSYSSLMHELIALAYHAATVRRLYVGSSAEAAGCTVTNLVTATNGFIVERIEEMLTLAEAPEEGAVRAFNEMLQERCRRTARQAAKLARELQRLQAAERVFKRFGIQSMVQETPWLLGLFGLPGSGSSRAQ